MRQETQSIVSNLARISLVLVPSSLSAQEVREVVLGPEIMATTVLDSPQVLYTVGDPEGPGMIFQGEAMVVAPVPAGGFLVCSAYYADGPIQYFRDGKLQQAFGRWGDGPGEYRQVLSMQVNPTTGDFWIQDRARMVTFTPDGEAGPVLDIRPAGFGASESTFLPDGSLLFVGPGGKRDNLGYLFHKVDIRDQTWTSYYPLYRDSTLIAVRDDHKWRRKLAVTEDGKVVAISSEYVIEIFDPDKGFALETRILRKPAGWPEDFEADLEKRRKEGPHAPAYLFWDCWVDPEGRLWTLSLMPEEDWLKDLVEDPDSPGGYDFATVDMGRDMLVEVLDLSRMELLASYRIDPLARAIVGPGMLAVYAGDLPYPQIGVIKIPLREEQ